MEQQIQDLVDSIRKEGLEKANQQRDEIIARAKEEAEKIVRQAKADADSMIENATKECSLRQQSAKASISQAARDVSITLKGELDALLNRILSDNIASAMDSALLSKLVLAVADSGLKDSEITVSTADSEAVVRSLKAELASKLADGLELKPAHGTAGLRIISKDGSGYIDLSADEIASMLKPYLSESLRQIIFN